MRTLWRILFHASPLIPFYFNKPYFSVALLLLVALCYIKVKKFDEHLAEPSLSAEQKKRWLGLRGKWIYLTFLS